MPNLNGRAWGHINLITAAAMLTATLIGCQLVGLPNPIDSVLLNQAHTEQGRILRETPPLGTGDDAGLQDLLGWDALPELRANRYQQFSSYNRAAGRFALEPGGKDFNNFLYLSGPSRRLLLAGVDGRDPDSQELGGYVLAEADNGPGYVCRMFFTRFSVLDLFGGPDSFSGPNIGRFTNESLRIFVDDLNRPAFVIPLADLGTCEPFGSPLAGSSSLAVTCYTPISFTQRLRVVMDGLCPLCGYFYHVDVKHTDRPTRAFSARLAEDPDYAAAAELLQRLGHNPNTGATLLVDNQGFELPAGADVTIFSDDAGGTIELLRFAFDNIEQQRLRQLQLRVFFDDAGGPAVDVPLDAFFGCREQIAPFATLPMRVECEGPRLEAACYLPMPFVRQIRVVLRNDGPAAVTLRASVGLERVLPAEPWGYLHARFLAVAGPQPPGSQFEVIDVDGRGRYVGTFLFAAGNSDPRPGELASPLNILEGNETGIIDGEVCIRGTGTEDYYNGAFYFATGPFDHPFAAANYVQRGRDDPGIVSCCRWHVLSDTIDFQRSFVLRFQYASDNPALVVRYATVAYYYLEHP